MLAVLYLNIAKVRPRLCAASLSWCINIMKALFIVRLGKCQEFAKFKTVSFAKTFIQCHGQSERFALLKGSFLFIVTVVSSAATARGLANYYPISSKRASILSFSWSSPSFPRPGSYSGPAFITCKLFFLQTIYDVDLCRVLVLQRFKPQLLLPIIRSVFSKLWQNLKFLIFTLPLSTIFSTISQSLVISVARQIQLWLGLFVDFLNFSRHVTCFILSFISNLGEVSNTGDNFVYKSARYSPLPPKISRFFSASATNKTQKKGKVLR